MININLPMDGVRCSVCGLLSDGTIPSEHLSSPDHLNMVDLDRELTEVCYWPTGKDEDMNYPEAWEISRSVPPEKHDPRCSTAQTSGAILCDCAVLTEHPRYIEDYGTGKDEDMSDVEQMARFRAQRPDLDDLPDEVVRKLTAYAWLELDHHLRIIGREVAAPLVRLVDRFRRVSS